MTNGGQNMTMDLKFITNDELKKMIDDINVELVSRVKKTYHEITIDSNIYKGTGKCWIQEIVDGKREGFVEAYNVIKTDKYRMEKTFRLVPGKYLVNECGSKSQDHRYYLIVKQDFIIEKEKL